MERGLQKGKGGWQSVPKGKHGGQRRRKGNSYEYRYPDGQGGWRSSPGRRQATSGAPKQGLKTRLARHKEQKIADMRRRDKEAAGKRLDASIEESRRQNAARGPVTRRSLNFDEYQQRAYRMTNQGLAGALDDIRATLPSADSMDREMNTDNGGYYRDQASVLVQEQKKRTENPKRETESAILRTRDEIAVRSWRIEENAGNTSQAAKTQTGIDQRELSKLYERTASLEAKIAPAKQDPTKKLPPHTKNRWDSADGKRNIVGMHASGKYLVATAGRTTLELIDPKDLMDEQNLDMRQLESRRKMGRAVQAEKDRAAAEKRVAEDTQGFTDKMTPARKAKVNATLNKQRHISGYVTTLKTYMQAAVADGAKVTTHRSFGRILTTATGSFFTQKDLTKTGLDFAEHLSALPPRKGQYGEAWPMAKPSRAVTAVNVADALKTASHNLVYLTEKLTGSKDEKSVSDIRSMVEAMQDQGRAIIFRDRDGDEIVDIPGRHGTSKSLYSVPLRRFVVGDLEKAGGWGNIPAGRRGGQRKRVGMKWVYRYPDGKGGWQSGAARERSATKKKAAAKKQAAQTTLDFGAAGEPDEPTATPDIVHLAAAFIKPGDVLHPFGDEQYRIIASGKKGFKIHLATMNVATGESLALTVSATDKMWVQQVGEQRKTDVETQPPKKAPASTPRGKASHTTESMIEEGEYVNDRESNVRQIGEDVFGSARHRAMNWKSLREALDSEDAPAMFTRKFLLREKPIGFIGRAQAAEGADGVLNQAHYYFAMNKFPAKPPKFGSSPQRGWFFRDVKREGRGTYDYHNSPEYKAKAVELEEARNNPEKWAEVSKEWQRAGLEGYYNAYATVQGIIEGHSASGNAPEGPPQIRYPSYTKPNADSPRLEDKLRAALWQAKADGKHPVEIESLRKTFNGQVSGKTRPSRQVDDIRSRATRKHGPDADAINSATIEAAMLVMEGKSINAAFGEKKSGKGYAVNLRDMYDTDKMERKGPESRYEHIEQGRKLMSKGGPFKMRGLQLGKSVTDQERVHHLKSLVDSFDDMAELTGLPVGMMGYNGKLAMAVGARGVAGALAHYEPTANAINLTRLNGAGSLAHEWGHFFDSNAGAADLNGGRNRENNLTGSRVPRGASQGLPSPTREAVTALRDSEAFQKFDARITTAMDKNPLYSPPEKQYWRSHVEMFARSFERHLQRKMAKQGRSNTYLVALRKAASSPDGLWPTDEEADAMAPLFENIFAKFKESGLLEKMMRQLEGDTLRKAAFTVPKKRFVVGDIR
jgi:hypothetical protein